jgi:hypothetical protein
VLADRFAQADERGESAAGEAGQQPVEQVADRLGGEAGSEDRADHFLHRPGACGLPAAGADLGEGRGLLVGEILRVLQQRPAAVLERLRGVLLAGLAQLVPVLAADLVQRLGRQGDDVVVVDHDRRLRRALAHALGVPAGHVHRDRLKPRRAREDRGLEFLARVQPSGLDAVPGRDGRARAERDHDRRLRLPRRLPGVRRRVLRRRVELVKERIGGRLAFPLRAPYHAPARMVGDEREVAVAFAPRDLVDRDRKQVPEPVGLGEMLLADALDDPADRLPVNPYQLRDRRLVGLRRQPRGEIVEIARETGPVTRERDALDMHAVLGTAQLAQRRADLEFPDPKVQMAPDRLVILDTFARHRDVPAHRADEPLAAQRDADHNPIGEELHAADPHTFQAQQTTKCAGDAHGPNLQLEDLEHPRAYGAACARRPTLNDQVKTAATSSKPAQESPQIIPGAPENKVLG